jgi:hypothetical protein
MVKMITVAGEPHSAPAPTADVELHALDFSFTVPDTLMAGAHTFHAVNDGPQVHEFQFVRLNDGVTVEQFMAAAAQPNQPPPGRLMGGPGAYSRGQEAYWSATLTPGNWLILCFVPDPADGKPHVMKGMVKPFTVPAS